MNIIGVRGIETSAGYAREASSFGHGAPERLSGDVSLVPRSATSRSRSISRPSSRQVQLRGREWFGSDNIKAEVDAVLVRPFSWVYKNFG